mmetsp:Transcript_60860/g.154661  ORF Transcript_60860/g.154661 Transcript_60860/m.154661 type:complete len:214 (-) Transcript_60860:5-646(-)
MVVPPLSLPAPEADLELHVPGHEVKERSRTMLEFGSDGGDGVPACLVGAVCLDLHDLCEQEPQLRDVLHEAQWQQHHAVVVPGLMTLQYQVAHVLHDARQALPVQLAARQQHDVRVRLQRALDCDVGPRVAGHADEDPEPAGRLGHAPQLPDVRAQGVAHRVVADGLLHEGEVAVDAHRHADDRALEALSSTRLGDECCINLSLHIADASQSV